MSVRLPAPERKDQILEVALRVFAERGFHETSMNDVAEAAGITKPVVYQHFASKRALFLAIINDVGQQMIEAQVDSEQRFRLAIPEGLAAGQRDLLGALRGGR